jgi:hypothetical protein
VFTPIRKASDLPPKGPSNEGQHREFKSKQTEDRYEIAKDVAAFANADGGTIFIGAKGNGEYLAGYEPLTTKEASAAQKVCDEAVHTRCAPPPIYTVDAIDLDGGVVVAVNVSPFPGQLVGVQVKKGEAKCGTSGREIEILYYYPLRVGAHTKGIRPEQLPMFMDPRVRRTALLLQEACGGKKQALFGSVGGGERSPSVGMWTATGFLLNVDILGNAVTIMMQEKRGQNRTEGSIPLDAIESVYRQGDTWRVLIRGKITFVPDEKGISRPTFDGF